jgi:alpha-tubulin suppressor-like RCC1 family protein
LLTEDGIVQGCGGNYAGQLADVYPNKHDPSSDSNQPFVAPLDAFVEHQISLMRAGAFHSLVLTDSGLLFGFGRVSHYRLGGFGTASFSTDARAIRLLMDGDQGQNIRDFSCGTDHNMVVMDDGSVLALGNNRGSQCGVHDVSQCMSWTPVSTPWNRDRWIPFSVCCGETLSFIMVGKAK